MRLISSQIQAIKTTVTRVLGLPHRLWLFGSRVDDQQRGGDIDLFIETDEIISNRAETICRVYGALIRVLGDRKLDVVIKDAHTESAPIFDIAKRTGVML
jgi:predicted nucleotidyltransferase